MANAEEIRRVVKAIETTPELWRQDVWIDGVTVPMHGSFVGRQEGSLPFDVDERIYSCNTRACVAGHTVMMAGLRIDIDDYVYDPEGNLLGDVSTVAAQILGLTVGEADVIFNPTAGQVYNHAECMYEGDVDQLKQVITETTGVTFDD